jgi:hypothetical protein
MNCFLPNKFCRHSKTTDPAELSGTILTLNGSTRGSRALGRLSPNEDRAEEMMTKTPQNREAKKEDEARKSKNEEDRQLSRELEESFPASDPPASTQPGSGITGPEFIKRESK